MSPVPETPEPQTLADALELLRQRDHELRFLRMQLAQAREDLEETNRGLIALYTELQEARETEARLAAVVQSSDDAIISMALDSTVHTWNPGANRLFGYAEAHIVGRPVQHLMPPVSHPLFTEVLRQIRDGEHSQPYDTQWSRADGTLVDVAVNVFALHDAAGSHIGFCAVARDITAQIEAQRQLEHMARFDALTGLANRAEIISRLQSELDSLRRPGPHVGVLFCDIDHFKGINDTWGHAVGDLVLATMAERINGCLRRGDSVGRFGGDEILVLLPGLHSLDDAAMIGEKIRARAAEPIFWTDQIVSVTLSIGATLAVPGESVSSMTARADVAMYEAKRSGRNMVTKIQADGAIV